MSFEEEEQQQLRLVDSIKQYHSQATILEINASNQDLSSQVMLAKRQKDCKAIASFQKSWQEWEDGLAGPALSCPVQQVEQSGKEEEEVEATGENVEDVFTEVVGQKRQQPGPEQGAKRLK